MKKHLALSVLPVLVVLTGCSGWDQDPFSKYSDSIKNGIPPKTEVPKPSGIPDDALVIEAPDNFIFKEGETSTYPLKARVLIPNLPATIEIKDMPTAGGASYDAKKGEFTWTPPKGTVTGQDAVSRQIINVIARTTKAPYYEIGPRQIILNVYRDYNVPQIVGISNLPAGGVLEGKKYDFEVIVKDMDSDGVTPPSVVLKPASGGTQMAPIPQILFQTAVPPLPGAGGQWKFFFHINTLDGDNKPLELTKGKNTPFSFRVQAFSVHGVPSTETLGLFNLVSTAKVAQASWESGTTWVSPGTQLNYTFQVYDFYNDSKVEASAVTNLGSWPGNARLTCSKPSGAGDSIKSCTLSWLPTSGSSGSSFDLDISAVSTGLAIGDKQTVTLRKSFTVN